MHGSIDNQTLLAATSGGALAVREEWDMSLHPTAAKEEADDEVSIRPEFAQPGERRSVPRFRLEEQMLPARTIVKGRGEPGHTGHGRGAAHLRGPG